MVKVRCRGGVDVVEAVGRGGAAGKRCAAVGAKVCWGGGASTLVQIRMYANAGAHIRKCAGEGALPGRRRYG